LRASAVAHADWSKDPQKRWVAMARWCDGRYVAQPPRPAWRDSEFFERLGPALVGFDFPIGLPKAYASRAGLSNFINALPYFSEAFYTIAERPEQISLQRPFYPRVPGGTSLAQLVMGLGFWSERDLLRECDVTAKAAPLFWTLGPRQPGRAAIAGWHDLLAPALRKSAVAVWPFHGTLETLVSPDQTVVAEAYPAEACTRIGVNRALGKGDQAKRAAAGPVIADWADYYGIELAPVLREQILDGFGADSAAEDRFDAIIGLFGMLDVVLGLSPWSEPADRVRAIEGWIIGLNHGTDRPTEDAAATAGRPAGDL
jgi:hypothetical protein